MSYDGWEGFSNLDSGVQPWPITQISKSVKFSKIRTFGGRAQLKLVPGWQKSQDISFINCSRIKCQQVVTALGRGSQPSSLLPLEDYPMISWNFWSLSWPSIVGFLQGSSVMPDFLDIMWPTEITPIFVTPNGRFISQLANSLLSLLRFVPRKY